MLLELSNVLGRVVLEVVQLGEGASIIGGEEANVDDDEITKANKTMMNIG